MKTVGQVMTHDVVTVAPTDVLQRAAQQIRDMNVGALPVCDGQRLVGMITDRDITAQRVAEVKTLERLRQEVPDPGW
nr:CBS domain-containing protein [Massilia sp. JS1662]